jgi:hypothetical protein
MKIKTINLILIYIITLILILLNRKNEYNVFIILLLSFILTIYLYKVNILLVLFLGILFCIVEIICIKYKLWKYNFTNNIIPIWLILAWSMSVIFILEINKIYLSNFNSRKA